MPKTIDYTAPMTVSNLRAAINPLIKAEGVQAVSRKAQVTAQCVYAWMNGDDRALGPLTLNKIVRALGFRALAMQKVYYLYARPPDNTKPVSDSAAGITISPSSEAVGGAILTG